MTLARVFAHTWKPVLCGIASGLVAASAVFSSTKNLQLRYCAVAICTLLCYLQYLSAVGSSSNATIRAFLISAPVYQPFLFYHLLVSKRASKDDFSAVKNGLLGLTSFGRAATAFLIGPRGVGSRWLVKNVPAFPAYYRGRRPTRGLFVLRQLSIFSAEYLLLDIVGLQAMMQPREEVLRVSGPGAERKFFSATPEQRTMRVIQSIVTWHCVARCVIDGTHRITSAVFVALGLQGPEDFPPIFGSAWEAYTIRQFWGVFWHQNLRAGFTTASTLITRFLGLPKPSLLERYTNILIVFSLSGFLHVVNDIGFGKTSFSQTQLFFSSFAFGILIEDGFQEAWRRITNTGKLKDSEVPVIRKIVGHIWTLSFFCIVTPFYTYPAARVDDLEGKKLVPFASLAEKLGLEITGSIMVVFVVFCVAVFQARPW